MNDQLLGVLRGITAIIVTESRSAFSVAALQRGNDDVSLIKVAVSTAFENTVFYNVSEGV